MTMFHLLTDIKNIGGREEILIRFPDFDFYKIEDILSFEFNRSLKLPGPALRIVAIYRAPLDRCLIELLFSEVSELNVPALSLYPAFIMLEVEDISAYGHENVIFEVSDFEEKDFKCRCKKIDISILDEDDYEK